MYSLLIYLLFRLRVLNRDEGSLCIEGFANFIDAKAEDLVPWTPLKTGGCMSCDCHMIYIYIIGYSGIDTETALYVLTRIAKNFVAVLSEEARTISDTDSMCFHL